MIAVIDYGAGNIRSIEKALAYVGARVEVTDDPAVVQRAQAVVLPGVGSGGAAMEQMTAHGLDDAIRNATSEGKPFLGICLGMQLLADHHEEGEVDGLRLFRGSVRRIPEGPKIPHMGWNTLDVRRSHPLLEGATTGPGGLHAYFVHSYQLYPDDAGDVVATADYGGAVTAIVARGNVAGTQFHPEKSQTLGLKLIANFLRWRP